MRLAFVAFAFACGLAAAMWIYPMNHIFAEAVIGIELLAIVATLITSRETPAPDELDIIDSAW